MAKFTVTQRTYRNGQLYEQTPVGSSDPKDYFFCETEDIKKHVDSVALAHSDEKTADDILEHAPDSKTAKKIGAARKREREAAEAEKQAIAKAAAEKLAEAKRLVNAEKK